MPVRVIQFLVFSLLWGFSSICCGVGKSPSLQVVLAEVEDASRKLMSCESELVLLSERLDEQETRLEKLSSAKPEEFAKKIHQLEIEQKTLAKTLSVLTALVKDMQSSIQTKFQEIQKDNKVLSQDIRLLRRSLLALVDGSSLEAYPDFSDHVPEHIHVVKSGETLGKIATKYQISVSELKKLNKLESDVIYANQKLSLPKHKK
ncbi:lysM domain protein [Chlamydia ibidis]|uniref:LysM domain protein n=2 Tax=Chlamydia ibidis TaxID=1405396 RepID=S7J2U5_9CHLA|nr:LysM peptidoglycan-binding domain-containing protein [Chlamydia ibidis]EPP34729.1 lysM domain protein [Chlamydia ibidis]EQM63072.1 lysM domain protein [Chlamydia ibidis 10-1398/6]